MLFAFPIKYRMASWRAALDSHPLRMRSLRMAVVAACGVRGDSM